MDKGPCAPAALAFARREARRLSAATLALQLAKETARRFATESLRPQVRRRLAQPDPEARVPGAIAREFIELGLGLVQLPAQVGGIGLAPLATCLVWEGLGHGDVNLAFGLPYPGPFADVLCQLGSTHQRRIWLHPLLERPPTSVGALVVGPPGTIVADFAADSVRVRGQVNAVWQADRADRYVVIANRLVEDGAPFGPRCAFVVSRTHEGLRVGAAERADGLTTASLASVVLDDVRIPRSQWLQDAEPVLGLRHAFAVQGLRMGSLALGAAHAASAYLVDLAEQRRKGGTVSAQMRSMGFLLVDMHLACESAFTRLREVAMGSEAQATANDGHAELDEAKVAAARIAADEVAFFVTESAQQMLEEAGDGKASHPVAGWHEDVKMLARSYRADAYFAPAMQAPAPAGRYGWLC